MTVSAPTGIITLLFTDIQDSTKLWESMRDGFRPVLDRHNALIRECIQRRHGYEVKSQGDSFMIAFSHPTEAIRCARDIQRALAAEPWPAEAGEILVRAGMHTGEPLLGRDPSGMPDYFGPMVNRSARIAAAGHGGQVLLSAATCVLVKDDIDSDLEIVNQGVHQLRGLDDSEHLYELRDTTLPHRKFEPLKTSNQAKGNLPDPPTAFLGRARELSQLRQLLRSSEIRLLTLIGFGGMGKTRAALQLAERTLYDWEDGVWWVEAEEVTAPEALVQRIAYQLKVHLQPQPSVREQLLNFLRERRLLLILDNTEQIPKVGPMVRELLVGAPQLKCIVTTRYALDISHERLYEIKPLPQEDAEELFVQRARIRKDEFSITPENAADVSELCRRLECVPLAIELAASRIVGMTPREIHNRLSERFRLLQTRAPDLPARQRALRGAIDWSWDLLTEEDKSNFAQLAVFSGGFTMADAEAVCDTMDVFEGVMELRRHSLLRDETDAATQQTRYLMLESVRDYAAEKLEDEPEGGAGVYRRHAQHFLTVGEQRASRMRTRDEAGALDELGSSADNLGAALRWCEENGEPEWCGRLAMVLYEFSYRRGFWEQARRHLITGLDAAAAIPDEAKGLRAGILHYLASIAHDKGDVAEAQAHAESSLALRHEANDSKGIAEALNLLGLLAMDQKDLAAADGLLNDALELLGERDHGRRGRILHNLARLASRKGDPEEGRRLYESALIHRRAAGDARGEAETLGNLGVLAQYAGNLPGARELYLDSLKILRRLRDRHWIAVMLFNLGEIAETEDDTGTAVQLFIHAERLFRELNSALVAEPATSLERLTERLGAETFSALAEATRTGSWEDLIYADQI